MWHCYYCRTALSLEVQKKNRHCPSCGSDIHSCRNCILFDESLGTKCKEPSAPWMTDRTSTNSCEYFEPGCQRTKPAPSADALTEAEKAKEAFRALFRNAE